VVHPSVQGASLAVTVDQVQVPERLLAVGRLGHQVADQPLQLHPVARCRQRSMVEVQAEVEVRILFPESAAAGTARLDDALVKARVGRDQPLVDDVANA
jgi:hypothetical protein